MNEFLYESDEIPLSAAGEHRRAGILRLARSAARARRQRRAVRRVLAVAMIVIGVFVLIRPHRSISPPLAERHTTPPVTAASLPSEPPKQLSRIVVTRIETDPTLLSRWSVGPQKPTWEVLSDDDLLRRLAEAGRPAGLAYVDGHPPILLFREPTRH